MTTSSLIAWVGVGAFIILVLLLALESLCVLYINMFREDRAKPLFRPLYSVFNLDYNEDGGKVFDKVAGLGFRILFLCLWVSAAHAAGGILGVAFFIIAVYIPYRVYISRI